jgi:hypothetical protein
MAVSQCPRKLWDYCLELKALIRTYTALDLYELQGQVPETIVSGQTVDISPFVEYAWFEWVIWYDRSAEFPEAKETLGRSLGPIIDIGPVLTACENNNGIWPSCVFVITQGTYQSQSSRPCDYETTRSVQEDTT